MNVATRQQFLDELRKQYRESFDRLTPEKIKKILIVDLADKGEITFRLTSEFIKEHELEEWLATYRKQAEQSTGGIRGAQNVFYCWDTRFPINECGIMLATVAKALVLKEQFPGKTLNKIVSGEVRYNTDLYIELISRIQASLGINIHQPKGLDRTTIWMTSFLIFMHDYDGGEYITSSHAVSSKTATKDLESEGGQFLPEMSLRFVDKIAEIIEYAKTHPEGFVITIAPANDSHIYKDFDGFDEYADYLKKIVATQSNMGLITQAAAQGMRMMFDTVGGCMYENMTRLFKRLAMPDVIDWHNSPEDSFFHGVGKIKRLNKETGKEEFFDVSCDVSLPEVSRTMGYDIYLKDKPVGYVVLITDPDGDRLLIGQVEPANAAKKLADLGIDFVPINDEKIVSIYHPAFTFLLLMDFQMKQLKAANLWKDHPRFIVVTTPSPRSWDEWASKNNIAVITTPVGIKEIATVMKKIERQLSKKPTEEIIVEDIWEKSINLGVQPRMVFGGEESGGMIMGPEELVVSRGGRKAIAMRDKSAGEASVIAMALAAHLSMQKIPISEYLENIFNESGITHRYYVRADITYYNESEPDPIRLKADKLRGETIRDKIDTFCMGLALGIREHMITMDQARAILAGAIPRLDFDDLEQILFTGDATYFEFKNMFVQIRRSGTDAKLRGYANGDDKEKCQRFLDTMVHYSGELTPLYQRLIPELFLKNIYIRQKELYNAYLKKGF